MSQAKGTVTAHAEDPKGLFVFSGPGTRLYGSKCMCSWTGNLRYSAKAARSEMEKHLQIIKEVE